MQNKTIFKICLIIFLIKDINFITTSFGQSFEVYDIPVYKNGTKLSMPFTGGLRAGQFSNFDFNNDGVLDLFVFDRNGDQVIPLLNIGLPGEIKYQYAPEYIPMFPKMRNWALIYDFNNDGVGDIFTSSFDFPGSIAVWKGKRTGDRLSYSLVTFNYGLNKVLQFPITNGFTQIYVSSIDFPGIIDVDGDGDVDILTFEPDGSLLQFYRNLSVDENLPIDSLKFVRQDVCWGRFSENEFSQEITLSNDPFSCATGFTSGGNEGQRHSGSGVMPFDADGDGDIDLVLGDLANKHVTFLKNGGTNQNAWMTSQDIRFPSYDTPIEIEIFLATFYVDVDGDGKRDLIATPNEAFNAENNNHVWFYKNVGTDASPVFNLVTKSLFIDEMLYLYSASHPVFFDEDGDGLLDILIGTNGINRPDGNKLHRMVLLRNTGTPENPEYEVEDEDYLNFSAYDQFTGRFAPALGDLDSDGDLDLMIGDVRGFLYYLENTAGPGNPVNFKQPVYRYSNIFIGQNAKPQIIDLDGDGLMDIVAGEKNNQFNFFKNIGTKGSPAFNSNSETFPNTDQLGNIYPGGNDFNTQSGAPFFIPTETDYKLLFGIETGNILLFENIVNNLYGEFSLTNENVGLIQAGRRVTLAMADINKNGYYEMAVGNERGGIVFYKTDFKVESGPVSNIEPGLQSSLTIQPNPTSGLIYVNTNDPISDYKVISGTGYNIYVPLENNILNLGNLEAGLYFIQLNINGTLISRKVVKY
ncbi:MAG: T9SS type A sorting domain-containing protein [Saprospiraceae bacterium]|nr:T9SS type A sorting domain-containing protein [Saprospiraceae bacterium]